MATRRKAAFRRQPRVDVERIGMAVSRPGIDPRTWATMGRTEADATARWFDPDRGWIVDVLTHGTTCHDASVPCRIAAPFPGLAGYGHYSPPGVDEEVIVVFPGGDPDEDPIVLGVVSNSDGGGAPKSVAGRSVLADGSTSPGGSVGAKDCEFSKSPHSRVAEFEGELHYRAKWVTIEATQGQGLKLGGWGAAHPATRADKLEALLGSFLDALDSLFAAGVTTPGGPGTMTGIATWKAAYTKLKALRAELASPDVVVT